jgi:membrane fusion protein (multidrug efflux system)
MRSTLSSARAAALGSAAFALVALTGCGPQGQPGGFQGFPPAPVTLLEIKTTTVPVQFEYVGQTAGSKEAQVRARVTGILEKRTYQEGGRVKAGSALRSNTEFFIGTP